MISPRIFRSAAAFVLLLTKLGAQPVPSLSAFDSRGHPKPLSIKSFDVEVQLFEDLARTTITVSFFNRFYDLMEGELTLPLPPGVTVSGYALEVNQKMRDGTTVEKEQARFAYESIKGQKIDPGYIERLPGNIYRTRIFPIPPRESKAVQLTFCSPLNFKKDQLEYHLRLPRVQVERATFRVQHLQRKNVSFVSPRGLILDSWTGGNDFRVTTKPTDLGDLIFQLEKPTGDAQFHLPPFHYDRKITPPAPLIPAGCQELEIIWDCSESGRQRNHQREFSLLNDLFQKHPDLTVHLTRLRLTTSPNEVFRIENGNWKKLREALLNTFYDGGTNLAAVTPGNLPILLFTDGHATWENPEKQWPPSLTLIDSIGRASPFWIAWACKNQGRYLKLDSAENFPRLVPSRSFTRKTNKSASKGTKTAPPAAREILRQLTASQELRTLESKFIPDAGAITNHCRKHQLVSDFTSLIVLERFEDHLRYRIPPPEPELLEKYREAFRKKEESPKRPDPPGQKLAKIQKDRKDWHSQSPEWQGKVLQPTLDRIAVWKHALLRTFEPEELNEQALESLQKTTTKIRSLNHLKSANNINTLQEWHDLDKQVEALTQKLAALESLTYGKPKGSKITVAVNGLVQKPGKLAVTPDTTLARAVEQAGGISKLGSGSRISIYRGSRKTTYNILSKDHNPVPLLPGDLIVVEIAVSDFSDAQSKPINHRLEPPVVHDFRELDFREPGRGSVDDPFATDDRSSPSYATNEQAGSSFTIPKAQNPRHLNLDSLRQQLTEGRDAEKLYRQLRPRRKYPDDFYLRLGDLFLEKEKPALATRALSNLIESPSPRPSAFRKWAYVLAKHSRWRDALDLLDRAARLAPNDHAITLDQAWVAGQLKREAVQQQHLQKIIATFDPADRNSTNLAHFASIEQKSLKNQNPLPLDLRIVISSASGQNLHLRLSEPFETIADFGIWSFNSTIGARTFESVGVSEYALPKALPGNYVIGYHSPTAQIIRLQIFRNWGRPTQTCEEEILFLPPTKTRRILTKYRFETK